MNFTWFIENKYLGEAEREPNFKGFATSYHYCCVKCGREWGACVATNTTDHAFLHLTCERCGGLGSVLNWEIKQQHLPKEVLQREILIAAEKLEEYSLWLT